MVEGTTEIDVNGRRLVLLGGVIEPPDVPRDAQGRVTPSRTEAAIRLMAAMIAGGRADYERMAADAVAAADALEAALAAGGK